MLFVAFGKIALGPLVGALKFTTPPATGSPEGLFTVTTNGAKTVLTGLLCGVPLTREIVNARDSKAPMSTVEFTCREIPR
jgi:hypothetical protein